MTQEIRRFEDYATARTRIAETLEAVAKAYSQLDAAPRAEQLRKLRTALESDTFKVLIIGEFKRGKSTLINAMLGQKVLPAKVAPCTAVITRVRYGERRRAMLHHRDGSPPLPLDLEKSPESLKEHLTIAAGGGEDGATSNGIRSNPYIAAEVFFPIELCRQNVEVVDSPGLNEHRTRTEVTREFLCEADALVLVLSCEMFLSQSERQFIDSDLKDRDLRDVFFLCNRFDAIRDSPADRKDIEDLVKQHIEPRTKGRARVFFLAAHDALNGRTGGNPDLLRRSNLPPFEAALEEFLATERGRVKLRTPVRICENAISEALMQLLPQREELIKVPLEELKGKLEAERPRLDEAEKQRERMLRTVERRSTSMIREAEGSLRTLIAEIETGLRRQAELIEVSKWEAIRSGAGMARKISGVLEDWLAEECRRWESNTLRPIIEQQWKSLIEDMDEQAEEFLANLESIKTVFKLDTSGKPLQGQANASALSRMFGAGVGLILGGPASALEGASFGVGTMAKGLALNVATVVGLTMLSNFIGLAVPLIFPAILALSVFRTFSGAQRAIDAAKKSIVDQISAELRTAYPKMEADLSRQVGEVTTPFASKIDDRMTAMVDEIRGQVQAVIRDREQQQQTAGQQLAEIAGIRNDLFASQQVLQSVVAGMEI
jgi:GTPase SAR1 family protein